MQENKNAFSELPNEVSELILTKIQSNSRELCTVSKSFYAFFSNKRLNLLDMMKNQISSYCIAETKDKKFNIVMFSFITKKENQKLVWAFHNKFQKDLEQRKFSPEPSSEGIIIPEYSISHALDWDYSPQIYQISDIESSMFEDFDLIHESLPSILPISCTRGNIRGISRFIIDHSKINDFLEYVKNLDLFDSVTKTTLEFQLGLQTNIDNIKNTISNTFSNIRKFF